MATAAVDIGKSARSRVVAGGKAAPSAVGGGGGGGKAPSAVGGRGGGAESEGKRPPRALPVSFNLCGCSRLEEKGALRSYGQAMPE